MENNKNTLGIIILALAILGAGIAVSMGLQTLKADQRTVSVRGLSEREFSADLAIWPVIFNISGNELPAIRQDIVKKTEIIKQYLMDHKIKAEEITVKEPTITDMSTNPYIEQKQYRYFAKVVLFIRSTDVAAVTSALRDSIDLMDSGIAITNDYEGQVQYLFTALNDVKPEMIAEATQNARKAAEQFAHDSGSQVGKIRKASQGLFSIEDAATGLPEKKTVRVVTTVEYILTD